MADFTIDTVNVEIEATAKSANTVVKQLTSQVKTLKTAIKELKTATAGLKGISSTLNSLGATAATTAKRLESIKQATAKTAQVTETANAKIKTAQTQMAAAMEVSAAKVQAAQAKAQEAINKTASQNEIGMERIRKARAQADKAEASAAKAKGRLTKDDDINKDVSGLNKITAAYERLKEAAKITKLAATLHQLTDAVMSFVDKSSAYVENLNLFSVQMGEFTEDAQKFVDKMEQVLGIDPSDAMRYMGFFMQIADSIGVASDAAYLMSKNFTLLSYDLSSFLNIDIEDAMVKLRAGMVGEVEPLRAVGYAITENTLQQVKNNQITQSQAESMNQLADSFKNANEMISENTMQAILNDNMINVKVRDLTEAQKVELRYVAIMQQATKAMGDMGNTINTPANQLRIFRQQINLVARSIGNIFIPILNKVLPYLIAMAQIIRAIADFIAKLLGFKLPEIDFGTRISEGASGIQDMNDGMDSINNKADKTKKKLKDIVAPFDELNIVDKQTDIPSTGTGSGGGGGADVGGGLDGSLFDKLPDYSEMLDKFVGLNVDKAKDKLKDLLTLATAIGTAFLAWKIADAFMKALPTIKDTLGKIFDKSKSIPDKIKDIAGNLVIARDKTEENEKKTSKWRQMLDKIPKIVSKQGGIAIGLGLLVGMLTDAYNHSDAFRKGLERCKEIVDILKKAAKDAFKAFTDKITEAAKALLDGLTNPIKDLFDKLGIKIEMPWIEPLLTFLSNYRISIYDLIGVLSTIITFVFPNPFTAWISGSWIAGTVIKTFFTGIGSMSDETWDKVKTKVSDTFSNVDKTVSNAMDIMGKAIQIMVENSPLGEFIDMIKKVGEAFGILTDDTKTWSEKGQELVQLWKTKNTDEMGGVKTAIGQVSDAFDDNQNKTKTWKDKVIEFFGLGKKEADDKLNGIASTAKTSGADLVSNSRTEYGNWLTETKKTTDDGKTKWTGWWTEIGTIFGTKWKNTRDKYNTDTKSWIDTDVKTTFSTSNWEGLLSGVDKAFDNVFTNAIDAAKTALRNFADWVGDMLENVWGALTGTADDAESGNTSRRSRKVSIPKDANGGLHSVGQMFIAREAGPEMVGTFGNKSAVVNNDQIVAAISQGVYNAVTTAMGAQSDKQQPIILELDGEVLYNSQRKIERTRGLGNFNMGAFSRG